MDPIIHAIFDLAAAGIHVRRGDDVWIEVYTAPGYPELTRNQVFDLARQQRPLPAVGPCPHVVVSASDIFDAEFPGLRERPSPLEDTSL